MGPGAGAKYLTHAGNRERQPVSQQDKRPTPPDLTMRPPTPCESFRRLSRRGVVQAGALGALGLGLPDLFRMQAAQAAAGVPRSGAADSVLLIWLSGGPSHQDLWDMKPDAPAEVRGEFKPIKTNVPGLDISELLPRVAQHADKFAMLRGIHHNRGEHEGAHVWVLTGYKPVRPFFALRDPSQDQPSMGSVIVNELGARNALPPYVSIPVASYNGAFNAFLSRTCAPFEVNGDPNADRFEVRDLGRLAAMSDQRYGRRRRMLAGMDHGFRDIDAVTETLAAKDQYYARAYDQVAQAGARGAFDIHQEPKEVRDRYGRNILGQSVLLARRLIQHGVRFVTIDTTYWGMYWDTHDNNFKTLRETHGPNLDGAYSALLEDMSRSGLLDRTLVLVMSEFGRTPKINAQAGRDHWPPCNVALFSGPGVKTGQVLGASDREAAYPEGDGFTPEDVITTIYRLLGVDPGKVYHDHLDRPWRIATGEPIQGLLR